MNRHAWAAAIIALAPVSCTGALAADDMAAAPPNPAPAEAPANAANAMGLLLLAVIINGQDTGKIGEFVERDGVVLARPAELDALGFRTPQAPTTPDGLLPLSAIAGVQYRIDRAAQTLIVTAPDAALTPALLGSGAAAQIIPVQSSIGATLNYDLVGTRVGAENTVAGQFDLRGFSSWGVASTGLLVSPRATDENSANSGYQAVRLDSTWTFSDPDRLTRYRIGDFINGGLGWSRPVRLGGGQFAVDFSLRPDLVTIPLPAISGTAAVPSSVDVLVNGIKVFSGQAQPGPFVIPQLPVVSGASNVSLAVTDALGRQVITTLPFYTGGGLLASGLQTWSLGGGFVRLHYATISNDYGPAALSGTWRRGISDDLTLEAHAEGSKALAMVGGGGVFNLANLGLINFGVAGSTGYGRSGLLVEAGFARSARPFSLNLNAIWAQRDFRDIAAQNFDPVPTLQLNGGIGFELGRFGTLSAAYNRIDRPADTATGQDEQNARLVSATYSIQLGRVSGFANGFHDLVSHSTGFMLGVTVPLGIRSSVTGGAVSDSGRLYGQIQSSQSAAEVGEFGYQAYAAEGSQSHEFFNGVYISPWAQLSAGADRTGGQTSVRLEAQGAISALDGALFPSPPVNDAFAVVDTNGLAGVHVLHENRVAGETDAGGRIFIRDLRSFEINHITIDPNDVPVDTALSSATHDVRPQDRSGLVIPFSIRRSQGALLRLVDDSGMAIPAGSAATLVSTHVAVPVGYDGEAYVEDLAAHNELNVTEPDGKRCAAKFDYTPRPGDIPVIGPVRCQSEQQ